MGSAALLTRANQLSVPSTLMLIALPCCPAAFLMLPVTLRQCQVRKWHLIRIAAYSAMVIPAVSVPLLCVAGFTRPWVGWLMVAARTRGRFAVGLAGHLVGIRIQPLSASAAAVACCNIARDAELADRCNSAFLDRFYHGASPLMASSRHKPNCPRCGYDLHGVVDAWASECPTNGTCAECGLPFYWGEVLRPGLAAPRWCVEHRMGSFAVTRASLLTAGYVFVPAIFWRDLRLHHPVRPSRLIMFIAVLLLAIITMLASHQSLMAVIVRWEIGFYVGQEKIRHTQLLEKRAAAGLGISVDRLPAAARTRCQAQAARECIVEWSYGSAVLEAMFRPRSAITLGRCTIAGSAYAYPPPAELHTFAFSRSSLGRGPINGPSNPFQLPYGFVLHFQLAWLIAVPLGFVLLPISRKRARVRWVHIIRIASYSLAIPAIIALFTVIAATVGYGEPGLYGLARGLTHLAHGLVLIPFCGIWWYFAIRDYLKMPHAQWIVVAFGMLGSMTYLLYRLATDNMGFADELLQRGWI